ncbi:hypothetical protein O0L34_g17139 [Tuta absoluta]|nr:hypothetical protein O0L34_g10123 [Tuta absoluta]KAJ2947372.1 hypothetical protein O0L34_g17139 [Tuta absoluta]
MLTIPFFSPKPEICPAQCLQAYISRTETLRRSDELFISFKKPYRPVGTQTLSRWVKNILKDSGIDVSIFSSHSTRHAATSQAHRQGVTIDQIRKTAGWSSSSSTFAKFYNRTVLSSDETALASAILNQIE